MNNPILTGFINTAVPMVMPVLSIVLVYVLKYIAQKTKNENAAWALERISQTVLTVVTNHMQTTMKNTGSDALEPNTVKLLATNQILEQLPPDVIKAAQGGVNNIATFIDHKIEKTVFDLKQKSLGA